MELSCGYGIGFASLGDVSFVIGLENGSRHIGRRQRKGRGKQWEECVKYLAFLNEPSANSGFLHLEGRS